MKIRRRRGNTQWRSRIGM